MRSPRTRRLGTEGGEGAGLGADAQQAMGAGAEPGAGLVVEADRAVVEPRALRPGQDRRGEAGGRHRAAEDHAGPQILVERQRDRLAGRGGGSGAAAGALGQGGGHRLPAGRGGRVAGGRAVQAADQLERDGGAGRRHGQAGGGGERVDAAGTASDPSAPGRSSAGRGAGAAASHAPQAIHEPSTSNPLRTRS